MLLTQIIRDVDVNVSGMALCAVATQLKGMTFLKIGIVDNFQKHIKRKIKKEPNEEP